MDPNQLIGWELSRDQSFIVPNSQLGVFFFFLLMTGT